MAPRLATPPFRPPTYLRLDKKATSIERSLDFRQGLNLRNYNLFRAEPEPPIAQYEVCQQTLLPVRVRAMDGASTMRPR